jgi:hypothetical protein
MVCTEGVISPLLYTVRCPSTAVSSLLLGRCLVTVYMSQYETENRRKYSEQMENENPICPYVLKANTCSFVVFLMFRLSTSSYEKDHNMSTLGWMLEPIPQCPHLLKKHPIESKVVWTRLDLLRIRYPTMTASDYSRNPAFLLILLFIYLNWKCLYGDSGTTIRYSTQIHTSYKITPLSNKAQHTKLHKFLETFLFRRESISCLMPMFPAMHSFSFR